MTKIKKRVSRQEDLVHRQIIFAASNYSSNPHFVNLEKGWGQSCILLDASLECYTLLNISGLYVTPFVPKIKRLFLTTLKSLEKQFRFHYLLSWQHCYFFRVEIVVIVEQLFEIAVWNTNVRRVLHVIFLVSFLFSFSKELYFCTRNFFIFKVKNFFKRIYLVLFDFLEFFFFFFFKERNLPFIY